MLVAVAIESESRRELVPVLPRAFSQGWRRNSASQRAPAPVVMIQRGLYARARRIAAGLLLAHAALRSGPAAAQAPFTGVVRFRSTIHARQDTTIQTTKGRRARFDYACQRLGSCTTIVDADAHLTMILQHDERRYVTITEADGRQIQAMRSVTHALLNGRQAAQAKWGIDRLRFEKTRRKETVAGVSCEVWVGHRPVGGDDDASEVCIAGEGVGIAFGLLDGGLVEGAGSDARDLDNGLPRKGFESRVLRLRVVDDGGVSTLEVIGIQPVEVDDSLFVAPAGYSEMRMSDVLSYLQSTMKPGELAGPVLVPHPGDTLGYPRPVDSRMARPPAIASCAWDSVAPTILHAWGEVTYQVAAEGTPDTVTLVVQEVHGADSRAFRVAAQRLVAACRFTALVADTSVSPTLMRQEIRLERFDTQPAVSSGQVFLLGGPSAPGLEGARLRQCGSGGWRGSGKVTAQLIVGVDGLPEPGTIRVLRARPYALTMEAPIVLAHCEFTPARYQGVPVRQQVQFTITAAPE